MARQVLDNGVMLPSEYSDDWYDDMTSNLTKLDEVIGSNAEKLSASDVGDAAISNDYDDLDDKPVYNILRRASVTLTAGGTGNYSDLDSDSKIKAGDYVLDAANKLYSITAIDAANSTYTVSSAAIINITDKSELGAAALSNSYDDLNNLPSYGITRYVNTAITDNSNVAFASISSVSKIAAGDFLLDTAGKLYQIASIDTVNETAAVTTPLTQLALDSGVVHINGNENINDNKNFTGLLTTLVNGTLWPVVNQTTDDITLLSANAVHVEQRSSGNLTDLSAGAWNIAELGNAAFFFRNNSGVDIRYKHFPTNLVNRIYVVNGANRHINDLIPDQDNTRDVGSNSLRWATFNGINPGALCFPDLSSGLDISAYLVNAGTTTPSEYTPLVNGWMCIGISADSPPALRVYTDSGFDDYSYTERSEIGGSGGIYTRYGYGSISVPVVGGVTYKIIAMPSTTLIITAKFFPCIGNV